MKMIEENINAISSSDVTIQEILSREIQTICIANLKTMIEATIESSGYAISNCIYDGDGIANTAFRSFYQFLDGSERDFNLEPIIIINALTGRNIFTQHRAIENRAQNQLTARITNFNSFSTEIDERLKNVTEVVEQQITILDSCIKALNSFVEEEIDRISSHLSVCHKFKQAKI